MHSITRLMAVAVPAVVLVMAPEARAQDSDLEPSMVFFELYQGAPKANKTRDYVDKVQEEIEQYSKYSLLARADAYKRIRTTMVTPTKRINDERLRAIEAMVSEGDKLLYTNPKKAIEVLRKAKVQLKEIVENISLDSKIRKDYFTTQMLLVRSHLDNGNAQKAREIMTEIVRTFEDEYPVTTENYHPRVVNLYKDVFRSLKDQRTATLNITSNPPGCSVYVNGRLMKQKTPFTFKGLYPGAIRVNIRKGELQSMVRKVDVPANGSGKVDIDLEYEAALSFSDDTFGLTFRQESSLRRNMLNYSVRLGRFLEVDYVVLAGVLERGGSPALVSYQVDVKKKTIVRQRDFGVKANVVSNKRIREMAAFLADVNLNATTNVVYQPWYKNILGWSLVGAGVVTAAVSIPFYSTFIDRKDFVESNPLNQTPAELLEKAEEGNSAQTTAGILVGVGSALIVGGALAFVFYKVEDDTAIPGNATTLYGAPILWQGGGGFTFGGRF